MDSPGFNTFENIAGRGVGLLAALTTIKSGGLGSYLMNRQRMMGDPSFRASLAGSPFAAGVFGVGGETGPAPAAPALPAAAGGGGVVQPGDFMGQPPPGVQVAPPGTLPEPTAQNVPGYLPGEARAWMPHLTPYDPKAALEQRGLATTELGLGSSDAGQRAQFKMAGGIPLNDEEMVAATRRATAMQNLGGPGTVVKLDIPGMTTTVGSPYNFSAITSEEYPSYQVAAAAAAARNAQLPPGSAGWTVVPSGRGTFVLGAPPSAQQQLPATPPAPAFRGPGDVTAQTPTTGGPPATVATRTNNPGNIKDSPFARSQPGYVGAGPAAMDGGRFAVFDSPASGFAAQGNLLTGPAYRDLSVGDALNKWSNGGYGGELVAPLGIDPARKVGSLTPEELQGVTLRQAHREGYQFGGAAPAEPPPVQVAQAPPTPQPAAAPPAPAPAPALAPAPARTAPPAAPAPPRPVTRPTPPAPAAGAPTWDPNATVPHVIVPVPEGRVGFPPAAFGGETPPSVPVTTTTLPPGAGLEAAAVPPPPMPPGRAAYDPTTRLPISGKTVESQTGSETFTAPNLGDVETQLRLNRAGITDPKLATPPQIANYFAQERSWAVQQKMDAADVERLRRGMSEGDAEGLRQLMDLRMQLDRFEAKYPKPEDRAQFVGPVTWLTQGVRRDIHWSDARQIADFRSALAPFSFDTLTAKDSPLKGDLTGLGPSAPNGSDSPEQFESNLQSLRDRLDDKILQRTAFRGVPESEITSDRVNGVLDAAQAARFAQRLKAFDTAGEPPPGGPPAAPPAPPAPVSPPPGTAFAGPPPTAPPPAPWQPTWVR
jgi:hypothetical protein